MCHVIFRIMSMLCFVIKFNMYIKTKKRCIIHILITHLVFIMSIILEQKDELSNSIDNLRDCFNDFDFLTKDGLSSGDLTDICGFEKN